MTGIYLASNIQLMAQPAIDLRRHGGALLAAAKRIRRVQASIYVVPSQRRDGSSYVVDYLMKTCTCPDHATTGVACKHWWAVEFATHPEAANDLGVPPLKPTYSQNWPAYNAAQTTEREQISLLLRALCNGIQEPPRKRGRPRLSLRDVVYAIVMKVYTTLSGRRASTDIRACAERGLITEAPHYNSVFRYIESEDVTPILRTMVEESAAPLALTERDFAVDSTGFTACTYTRWLAVRGQERREHNWVKCHAMIGVRSHVATAVEVTEQDVGDCPLLPLLVERTRKRFPIREVSADKAYSSFRNFEVVDDAGAEPYILFKNTVTGKTGPDIWRKLFGLFLFHREDFLARYHKRSNVEAFFSSVKRKFGPLRSRSQTAMFNEVYAKILAHNLSMIVHAIHELGVAPKFWTAAAASADQAPATDAGGGAP